MMQLNPALPVDTPHGPAYAHMVIDYSQEHYVLFVCFLQETGECWVLPNRDVKLQMNVSMGVRTPRPAPAARDVPANPAAAPAAPTGPGRILGLPLPAPYTNGNGASKHESHD